MLTLEQIQNVTFFKVRGGYAAEGVDEFIDQCVETVASLTKERNTANEHLQVLAAKLKEYRDEEDSIRSALLTAQRAGDSIVREATQKADLTRRDAEIKAEKVLEEAEAEARRIVNAVSDEVHAQERELARLKQEVAQFKEQMLTIYRDHLSLIGLLPEEPVAESVESAPTAEESAAVPEEVPAQAEIATPATEAEPEKETAPVAESVSAESESAVTETPAQPVPLFTETDEEKAVEPLFAQSTAEEPETGRFSNLQFGDGYAPDGENDEEKPRGLFRRRK